MESGHVEMILAFNGFVRVGNREKAVEFVELLERNHLRPLKFDASERPKYPYDAQSLINFWCAQGEREAAGLYVVGRGFSVSVDFGGSKPYVMSMSKKMRRSEDPRAILDLAEDLYYLFEACYGHVSTDLRFRKLYSPGFSILHCLPGIAWGNLFGKPYIDMWGRQKLQDSPAYRVDSLRDGGAVLLSASSPFLDGEMMDDAESRIIRYLGKEYFYEKPDEPETYRSLAEFIRVREESVRKATFVAPSFDQYYDLTRRRG